MLMNRRRSLQNGWRQARTQNFLNVLGKHLGLVCFSECCEDILMWSHYGANHSGLVIGFDTEKLPITLTRDLHAVRYVNRKVAWDQKATIEDKLHLATILLTSKFGAWKYEREWRSVVPLDDCQRKRVSFLKKGYFVSVPAEAIVRVIMGARCDFRKMLPRLMWYCGRKLNSLPIERAVLHPDRYELQVKTVLGLTEQQKLALAQRTAE
jgi:Protein of unknown function (DUF2971)